MGFDPCPTPGQYNSTIEPNFTLPLELQEMGALLRDLEHSVP
jgi:hypothetical protein